MDSGHRDGGLLGQWVTRMFGDPTPDPVVLRRARVLAALRYWRRVTLNVAALIGATSGVIAVVWVLALLMRTTTD